MQRFYKNGNQSLIIFPDGTGNAYYESGQLAVVISFVAHGMHIYTVLNDDAFNTKVLAVFDPFGNVLCNYPSGKIRFFSSQNMGLDFFNILEISEFRRIF